MTVADILNKAADLIEPEGRWCQGSHAVTRYGSPTSHPMGTDYKAFCPEGACLALIPPGGLGRLGIETMLDITRHIQAVVPGGNVPKWNDAPERTQAEVVGKLREAASLAQRSEGE